jgi:ABC-type lipoprotein release transport system permease subunit
MNFNSRKTKKIISAVIIIVLVLSMIVPVVVGAILNGF